MPFEHCAIHLSYHVEIKMHYKSVDHAESHLLSYTLGFDPALIREYAEELFARQESRPEDDEGWDSDLENQDVENCDVVR